MVLESTMSPRSSAQTAGRRPRYLVGVLLGLLTFLAAGPAAARGVFDVRDYGAAGDGKTVETGAIQAAIDACAAAGGGRVYLAGGRFVSGTIHLKSNVALFVEAGTALLGSPNLDDYPESKPSLRSYTEEHSAAEPQSKLFNGKPKASAFAESAVSFGLPLNDFCADPNRESPGGVYAIRSLANGPHTRETQNVSAQIDTLAWTGDLSDRSTGLRGPRHAT